MFALFRKTIKCPLCKNKINIKEAKSSGELEVLGKDERGCIIFKHKGFCGANIVWDTLSNKVSGDRVD